MVLVVALSPALACALNSLSALVGKHIVARPPWIDLLQQALQRHQTNHDILTTIGDIVALLSAKGNSLNSFKCLFGSAKLVGISMHCSGSAKSIGQFGNLG